MNATSQTPKQPSSERFACFCNANHLINLRPYKKRAIVTKYSVKISDQSKNGNLAGTKSCFAGSGDLVVSVAWEGVGV